MPSNGFAKLRKDLLGRKDINAITKLAYAFIVDAMRGKRVARPGVRAIAKGIGCWPSTAQEAIDQIEEAGLLVIKRRGNGRSNLYFLPDRERTDSGNGSAPKIGTLPKCQAHRNSVPGVPEIGTEAHRNSVPKKTKTKKKTTTSRASASTDSKSAENKSDHQSLIDHFTEQWSKLIGGGGKYPFAKGRDGKAAKTILEAVTGDLDRAKAIVDRYLTDDDPWLLENGKGRGLALLASRTRLREYLAATAIHKPQRRAAEDSASAEHPFIADAREKWPDDVAAHPEEWRALAMAVEDGHIPGNAVIVSDGETGEQFRTEHNQELARVAN